MSQSSGSVRALAEDVVAGVGVEIAVTPMTVSRKSGAEATSSVVMWRRKGMRARRRASGRESQESPQQPACGLDRRTGGWRGVLGSGSSARPAAVTSSVAGDPLTLYIAPA